MLAETSGLGSGLNHQLAFTSSSSVLEMMKLSFQNLNVCLVPPTTKYEVLHYSKAPPLSSRQWQRPPHCIACHLHSPTCCINMHLFFGTTQETPTSSSPATSAFHASDNCLHLRTPEPNSQSGCCLSWYARARDNSDKRESDPWFPFPLHAKSD